MKIGVRMGVLMSALLAAQNGGDIRLRADASWDRRRRVGGADAGQSRCAGAQRRWRHVSKFVQLPVHRAWRPRRCASPEESR